MSRHVICKWVQLTNLNHVNGPFALGDNDTEFWCSQSAQFFMSSEMRSMLTNLKKKHVCQNTEVANAKISHPYNGMFLLTHFKFFIHNSLSDLGVNLTKITVIKTASAKTVQKQLLPSLLQYISFLPFVISFRFHLDTITKSSKEYFSVQISLYFVTSCLFNDNFFRSRKTYFSTPVLKWWSRFFPGKNQWIMGAH